MWWIFALLSAFFAALTAIFAKIGIKGVDTDLATGIRTVIILLLAWVLVFFQRFAIYHWQPYQNQLDFFDPVGMCHGVFVDMLF